MERLRAQRIHELKSRSFPGIALDKHEIDPLSRRELREALSRPCHEGLEQVHASIVGREKSENASEFVPKTRKTRGEVLAGAPNHIAPHRFSSVS
jgi:hypothetical protein